MTKTHDPQDAARPWIRTDVQCPRPLRIGPEAVARVGAWAVEGHPYEACGLLVGRPREGEPESATEVVRVELARNVELERAWDRYTLAPEDWLRIENDARAEELEVVGIWHSHPDHPALPSYTDMRAAWEGYAYLIVAVGAEGPRDWRSWQLEGGLFVEQPVHTSPSSEVDPR